MWWKGWSSALTAALPPAGSKLQLSFEPDKAMILADGHTAAQSGANL